MKLVLDSKGNKNVYIYSLLELELIKLSDQILKDIQQAKHKESFILELLHRYEHRPTIVRESLVYLDNYITDYCEPRPHLITCILRRCIARAPGERKIKKRI